MRQISRIFFLALILALVLSGCGPHITPAADKDFQAAWDEAWEQWEVSWDGSAPDAEKSRYYQILDGEETLLCTVSGEEADALDDLFSGDENDWGARLTDADGGQAAYIYCYCQEKTLLAGQDPDEEREYEELVRFTVYQDRDLITMEILGGLENLQLPGVDLLDLLTFTFSIPEETASALRDPAQFTKD